MPEPYFQEVFEDVQFARPTDEGTYFMGEGGSFLGQPVSSV